MEQLAAGRGTLSEARKRRAVVAVAKLDRIAYDMELVLRIRCEAESNGMCGFLFCDLPEVDATTSAGCSDALMWCLLPPELCNSLSVAGAPVEGGQASEPAGPDSQNRHGEDEMVASLCANL